MKSETLDVPGWEKVVRFEDERAGLRAIIAVHSTALGPGCGGLRMRDYESFDAALEDVKRLSEGMTWKNALGGIPFGGGKSVILGDPKTEKTEAKFRAFGRAVEAMGGDYVAAQDSGITPDDLKIVRKETKHVSGIPGPNGEGGDPSPHTAYGVWRGMQAAVARKLGKPTLEGLRVVITGVGGVGMNLAKHLHGEGAHLIVADVDEARLDHARRTFGARIVAPEAAPGEEAEVFAPCAFGGAINEDTVRMLRAPIVAGGANNQLATPKMDRALFDKGVLYCPDYVINAAGVISVGFEALGVWRRDALVAHLDRIPRTLETIFERSTVENRPTGEIADALARETVAAGGTPDRLRASA